MKKIIRIVAMLLLSFKLSAQYKKAGFFEKEGRTYEIGTQLYSMGKGNGSPIGYKISFGRDRDGKTLFTSWDLQFIPSHKYSYSTTDENNTPINVTGSSKLTILYGLNWGFHLLNNDADEKPRVQPYITTGIVTLISSGVKSESYSSEPYGFPKRSTSGQTFSVGLSAGVGSIFNLNSKLALKIQGGYTHQFNLSLEAWDDDIKPFYVYDSHIFGSVGLRLRIVRD